MRWLWSISGCLCFGLCGASAWAQPADFDDDDRSDESFSERGESAESDDGGDSDHEGHAGHLGLGFMGTRFVPSALPGAGLPVNITDEGDAILTIEADEVTVPMLGLRYWFGRRVGVELGLGFNVASGSESRQIPNPDPALNRTTEIAAPSTTAFAIHLAVPISVYSTSHFNLLLLPEMDVGYSTSSMADFELSTTGEALDLELRGFSFGAGARIGSELSFGFFNLPGLALQASFGFRVETRSSSGKIGDAEMDISETRFGTSWRDDPWDLLAGNLGLLYYF